MSVTEESKLVFVGSEGHHLVVNDGTWAGVEKTAPRGDQPERCSWFPFQCFLIAFAPAKSDGRH